MTDQNISPINSAEAKDELKKIPAIEKSVIDESSAQIENEVIMSPETSGEAKDDRMVSAELHKEIAMMEMDEKTKAEAKKKAEKIEFLGEKEKIEHLLQIAREKGVVFAIQVARRTNDPYLLDILHDTLSQEGYFKDFTK